MLFTPGAIGLLELPNRLVRSATAERMADEIGVPQPKLKALYQDLVKGGIGLIITGHMYVNPAGKCHSEMTGVYQDELIPGLSNLTQTVHQSGGKIACQINHGGGKCDPGILQDALSPSAAGTESIFNRVSRELSEEQILDTINDFTQAAWRVKEAGFDAVQIHSAHGYLINQFLSPLSNQRNDQWGGSLENRSRFLREISQSIRNKVGEEYPVFIKFGIADGCENGFLLEEGLEIISTFDSWGLDGVEISSGFSGDLFSSIQQGIKSPHDEGYFLPFVKKAREITRLPILAVGGFRSRMIMEKTLLSGAAEFISLCRPLIREPHLPNQFLSGSTSQSDCISANLCWAENPGEGISCKCFQE